jgi:hypothetical protein
MNLTLQFAQDVPGVLHKYVEAYDLVQGKTIEKLDRIARQLGVKPIVEFGRDDPPPDLPQEAQLAMLINCWDEERWGARPEPLWYDPAEGLATVRAILAYLDDHPRTIRSGLDELKEMEQALQSAAEVGVRFHVYFDI